jgi:hypothetical protein
MIRNRRRLLGGIAVGLGASIASLWIVSREIPFDQQRWKHPTFRWDRWRMQASLRRELDKSKPSQDTVVSMLDTQNHRYAYINSHSKNPYGSVLYFDLGSPPITSGRFLPVRGLVRIYFDRDGNYVKNEAAFD